MRGENASGGSATFAGSRIHRTRAEQRAICEALEQRTLLSTAGQVDTSFGGGSVGVPYNVGLSLVTRAVAVQSDGKIVAVGSGVDIDDGSGSVEMPALARYNTDGTFDKTFGEGSFLGGNGYFFTNLFGGLPAQAEAVAIQPSGKIVVAGDVFNGDGTQTFFLARYLNHGTSDKQFGDRGTGMIYSEGFIFSGADAMALRSDGSIIIAGTSYDPDDVLNNQFVGDFSVARFSPDGIADLDFIDKAGDIDLGGDDRVRGMTIDYSGTAQTNPNYGKIIVVGSSDNKIAVVRLNTDGSLDDSFSGDGELLTQFNSQDDNSAAYAVT